LNAPNERRPMTSSPSQLTYDGTSSTADLRVGITPRHQQKNRTHAIWLKYNE
jgi:hypothetical protein